MGLTDDSYLDRPTIRRLARRGGVKRIKSEIYQTVQQIIKNRIAEVRHTTVPTQTLTSNTLLTPSSSSPPSYDLSKLISLTDPRTSNRPSRAQKPKNTHSSRRRLRTPPDRKPHLRLWHHLQRRRSQFARCIHEEAEGRVR